MAEGLFAMGEDTNYSIDIINKGVIFYRENAPSFVIHLGYS